MKRLSAALRRETRLIRSSRPLLAALLLVPALSLVLIAAMLSRGSLDRLPVALVDEANSPASRALASALTSQGGLAIARAPANEAEADVLLRSGTVWGYLVIPASYGATADGTPPPVRIAYNATYLSVGSLVERQMRRAVEGAFGELALARAAGLGADIPPDRLPQVQVKVLFNPQASLEWYLEALLHPAMLHLLAACLGAYVVSIEIRHASLLAWREETGGGVAAWTGKFFPHLAILSLWGAVWMIWLVGLKGWRMQGSLAFAYSGQVAMLAASLAISGAIAAATRRSGIAFSASALYAGSALAYSGGSLPTDGAALPVVWWSEALPFTHYLRLQMDQFLGSPLHVDLPAFLALLAYGAAGFAVCVIAGRRSP